MVRQGDALLAGEGLGRRVGARWIWRGIHLHLRPGDRLALRGATGAGKSMLLRTLVLLEPVQEGVVLVDGARVQPESVPHVRSRIIYVPQRPAFRSGTVADVLRQPFTFAANATKRFDPSYVAAWLRDFGRSEAFLGQDTQTLSGGEAQLAALLRALLLEPQVLLLDEPTAAMDPETTQRAEDAILRWHAADPRRALIWVSHDPMQLERVTCRSTTLGEGGMS